MINWIKCIYRSYAEHPKEALLSSHFGLIVGSPLNQLRLGNVGPTICVGLDLGGTFMVKSRGHQGSFKRLKAFVNPQYQFILKSGRGKKLFKIAI